MKNRLLILCLSFLYGCASSGPLSPPAPDNYLAATFKSIEKPGCIILLPNISTDPLINRGEDMLLNQLQIQLKQAGYKVAALDQSSYDSIWAQEVLNVGGIYDQKTGALKKNAQTQALAGLVSRVCEEAKCTHVIKPMIAARIIKFDGDHVYWDSQRRPISTSYSGGHQARFKGDGRAFSVELVGLDAQGEIMFKQYGGASLVHQADLADTKLTVRPSLFTDDKEIADGVRIALKPMLDK